MLELRGGIFANGAASAAFASLVVSAAQSGDQVVDNVDMGGGESLTIYKDSSGREYYYSNIDGTKVYVGKNLGYVVDNSIFRRSENGLIKGLQWPWTPQGSVKAVGSYMAGVYGNDVSSGPIVSASGQTCVATTACSKFGLGIYGGGGGEAALGVDSALVEGAKNESWGIFFEAGGVESVGGSIIFSDSGFEAVKGFYGKGAGGAAGVKFCETTVNVCN